VTYLAFQVYDGFGFMKELVDSMTDEDPWNRPKIEEVLEKWMKIQKSLSKSKLRSPILSRKLPRHRRVFKQSRQIIRTNRYIVSRRPPIPDPNVRHTAATITRKVPQVSLLAQRTGQFICGLWDVLQVCVLGGD
jgi:hypothetical protein